MKNSFENTFDWKKHFIVSENVIRQKENSEIEFKETFHSPKHKDKKLHKWIASFANANGGLIIYGVKNNGELIGLKDDRFKEFDSKDLSEELIDYFAPEIKFEIFSKNVEGFELGFLYIHKSEEKPVVAIKTANNSVQESDIFYRYPGQSKTIAYGDLRNIIEEKVQKNNDKWMKLMNNIATIGVENVGLLNIDNGDVIGTHNKFIIPEDLLKKVKFINEGTFVEKDGAPALKLVGEFLPIDSTKVIQLVEKKYQIITHFELFQTFFKQHLDENSAKDFFRQVAYENTAYYPIYFYLMVANLNISGSQVLLNKEKGSKVNDILNRFSDEKNNFNKFIIGKIDTGTESAKKILNFIKDLKSKKEINVKLLEPSELRYFIQAITHLKKDEVELNYILNILKQLYDEHFSTSQTTKSFIRKAICHIDLIVFGEKILKP